MERVITSEKTKMIPIKKKRMKNNKKGKRKPVLFFKFYRAPIIPTHYFCCLKLALVSLILYHSFSLSLSLSIFLSPQREQLSCNLPSERNSMLHKTHTHTKRETH